MLTTESFRSSGGGRLIVASSNNPKVLYVVPQGRIFVGSITGYIYINGVYINTTEIIPVELPSGTVISSASASSYAFIIGNER